jgi:hypothetical protein
LITILVFIFSVTSNLFFLAHVILFQFYNEKLKPLCAVSNCSFIDDAYQEGIPVVILTAYSKSGDKIAGYALLVTEVILYQKIKGRLYWNND